MSKFVVDMSDSRTRVLLENLESFISWIENAEDDILEISCGETLLPTAIVDFIKRIHCTRPGKIMVIQYGQPGACVKDEVQ